MKITNTLKTATKSLLSIGLLSTSLLSHADEFNLFSLPSAEGTYSQQSPESDIVDTLGIQISTLIAFAEIQLAEIGDEIVVPVPSGEVYRVKIEGLTRHGNGDISLAGSVNDEYRAMITHGKSGSYASIETPEGKYKIEIRSGKEWLLTPDDLKNLIPAQFKDDSIIPNLLELDLDIEKPIIDSQLFAAPSQEGDEDMATIDVMVLYTPELKEKRGGVDALESRINHLVTLSNKAYEDSKMAIAIRLVHSEEIAANNNANIFTELPNLKDGSGVFESVLPLRESKGADLVILMRDYVAAPAHTNCGLAYTLGSQGSGTIPYGYRVLGYGIVHDGSTESSVCSDYTFAHELGHNFGFKHDRANSSVEDDNSGAFDYSYGYDVEGKFATIMSYNTPQIGMFSNPDIFCNLGTCDSREPLGVAGGEENSANNAKAGNNVRFDIANFYEAVSIAYDAGDETGDGSVDISDVVAIINLALSGGNATKGGDCNGDGKVNVQDIVCTINLVLNKK